MFICAPFCLRQHLNVELGSEPWDRHVQAHPRVCMILISSTQTPILILAIRSAALNDKVVSKCLWRASCCLFGFSVACLGDIPDDRVFEHRFACTELHPGLCAFADAAVYDDVLELVGSLKACLDRSMLHRYLKFFNPEAVDISPYTCPHKFW